MSDEQQADRDCDECDGDGWITVVWSDEARRYPCRMCNEPGSWQAGVAMSYAVERPDPEGGPE